MNTDFVIYVRTLQFWQLRIKNKNPHQPVYVDQKTIYTQFNLSKAEIDWLVIQGEIEITEVINKKGYKTYQYRALKKGVVDFSMLKQKKDKFSPLMNEMKYFLNYVSLSNGVCSTLYFDAFLFYKKYNLDLFFNVDDFSGRVHTPVTGLKSEIRKNILIKGERTTSLDVVTMQPLLLGKILENQIGINEFSEWINSGKDIYLLLKEKAKLESRKLAKIKFFEILYGKANNNLATIFTESNWISWINEYKSKSEPRNKNTKAKPHSNLSWLLQKTEVFVMQKVWQLLVNNDIPFLSVHDEIIVRERDFSLSKELFEQVLHSEFKFYKLNTNKFDHKKEKAFSESAFANKEQVEEKNNLVVKIRKWDKEIDEIEQFFSDNNLTNRPIDLHDCLKILDVSKFIRSHMSIIKANNGNRAFYSYLERLIDLVEIIKK